MEKIKYINLGVFITTPFWVTISELARTPLIWKKYEFEDIWCNFFSKNPSEK